MPVRFTTAGPARLTVHLPGDSPFLPPGNQWHAKGAEPVADTEKVPAPERMFDTDGRLAYGIGALVPASELAGLIPESRLHQAEDGHVTPAEPEPVSVKPTKAKTRARKPSENR